MTTTTIKVPGELRDELSRVASDDFGGATLAETIRQLMLEHTKRKILEQYARLQAQPEAWADYLEELREWAELGAGTVRRSGE